jgi:hypothetical protein
MLGEPPLPAVLANEPMGADDVRGPLRECRHADRRGADA